MKTSSLPTLVKNKRKISAKMGKSFPEHKGVKVETERGSEELTGSCVGSRHLVLLASPHPKPPGQSLAHLSHLDV